MTAQDWVGRVIDGRYVVETIVGRGGMGVVLAARHKFTGARVAVKMVRRDLGLDAEIEGRFLAEARIPETIGHRSVVKTLDAGKTPEGELYLVMELLAGRSLRYEIMRGVGAPSVRRIGMELLDVLAAAHARGIVHRDVKPENVFLVEPDASVKLLDFGITKVLAGSRSVLPRTEAGVLLGTIEYMPPEQLADAGAVDARADLWAVSVILYEMLAGRRPHRANTVEEMFLALVRGQPDPIRVALPSATPDIEAFFARALEREPERRFATAAEMAVALARLPLAVSVPVAPRPATGNVTMATGFAATGHSAPATPHSMVQPAPVAPHSMVQPAPVAPHSMVQPAPVAPHYARSAVGPPPTTGTIATISRTVETPAAQPRHRFGLVLAAVGAVAFGAAVVVVATRGGHSPSSPPVAVSPSVAPAPSVAPSPSVAPAPSVAPSPSPPPTPQHELTAAAEPASAVPASTVQRTHTKPSTKAPSTSRGRHADPSTKTPASQPAVTAAASPASPTPAPPSTASAAAPASPAASPTAAQQAELCTAGCKMLAGCHLGSSSCEADCAQNRTLHNCLQLAANDCTRFASCWFGSSCRVTPRGTHSCSEAMDCEASCRNDQACICRCVGGLSPAHSLALLAYNGCALGCRDNDCIQVRCAAQARRCRAE